MSEGFDADWLALREGWDARARAPALAARLAAALPARPTLLDLGAGTGSLFRWLAPRLDRPQAWLLVDADQGLLDAAFVRIAAWAEGRGHVVTWPGRALLVHTPRGAWRVEGLIADLAGAPLNLPLRDASAVVNSALCDLVSAAWVEDVAAALTVPFYAALCVDGREAFLPRHPGDAAVARGFRRDQGRDKGFGGRALGAAAPGAIRRAFAAAGFRVITAPSPWRIPAAAAGFAAELAIGHADAARAALPGHGEAIAAWRADRLARARRGGLAARIGHRDLLALPG